MINEYAYVVEVNGADAVVKAERKSSCEACSINKGCGTSVLASVLGKRSLELSVRNDIGASVGDNVIVGIPDSVILRGSILIYLVPVLTLLLGAIFGTIVSPQLNLADGFVAISGILGLLLGFLFARSILQKISGSENQAVIVERLNKGFQVHTIKVNT